MSGGADRSRASARCAFHPRRKAVPLSSPLHPTKQPAPLALGKAGNANDPLHLLAECCGECQGGEGACRVADQCHRLCAEHLLYGLAK
jgi:hypothetical protein